MKVFITEDVAWEGKFYRGGIMADVPDKLAAALGSLPIVGTENTTPIPVEDDPEKPEEKRRRKPSHPETIKPENINTEV
jgi:hypothetical protein